MTKRRIALRILGILVVVLLSAYVLSNVLLDRKIVRLEQKLVEEKATLSDLMPPVVPDEENAALVWKKVFAEKKYVNVVLDIDLAKTKEWDEKDKSLVSAYLEDGQEALRLTNEALTLEKCNWNLDYSKGLEMLTPHPQGLRRICYLLRTKGLFEEHSGNPGKALDAYLKIFRCAEYAGKDTGVSYLVQLVIKGFGASALADLLKEEELEVEQYRRILAELEAVDIQEGGMWKALKMDRVGGIIEFNLILDDPKRVAILFGGSGPPVLIKILKLFPQITKMNKISYLETWGRLFCLDQPPYIPHKITSHSSYKSKEYRVKKIAEKLGDTTKIKLLGRILSVNLFPAVTAIFRKQAMYDVELETLRLAVGLKLYKNIHGDYPDNLTSLTPQVFTTLPLDPFSGKNFLYYKEGEGFIIYSIGMNSEDDGGFLEPCWRNEPKNKREEHERISKQSWWRREGDIGWRFEN